MFSTDSLSGFAKGVRLVGLIKRLPPRFKIRLSRYKSAVCCSCFNPHPNYYFYFEKKTHDSLVASSVWALQVDKLNFQTHPPSWWLIHPPSFSISGHATGFSALRVGYTSRRLLLRGRARSVQDLYTVVEPVSPTERINWTNQLNRFGKLNWPKWSSSSNWPKMSTSNVWEQMH